MHLKMSYYANVVISVSTRCNTGTLLVCLYQSVFTTRFNIIRSAGDVTCSRTCVLANVKSRSRSLYAVARPSVVCLSVVGNARAPYSGGSNFRQYFYGFRYLGYPLTFTENFAEIVPRETLRRGS